MLKPKNTGLKSRSLKKVENMSNRKDDHIYHALDGYTELDTFANIELVHQSLSTVNLANINLSTTLLGKKLANPIYINAMTGGSEKGNSINDDLAQIASQLNLMLALGSVSPALADSATLNRYIAMREKYPNLILCANIGVDKTYAQVAPILEAIKPNFLQVHLNTLQELLMPEGNRDFSTTKQNLADFIKNAPMPVIVKEVGFGMSYETVAELINLGAQAVDISGKGGTNFATIENARRTIPISYLNTWGLYTLDSLLENQKHREKITLLASGGINTALDVAKCVALGANAVGISGSILQRLQKAGVAETTRYLESLLNELKTIMTLLDAPTIAQLQQVKYVVKNDSYTRLQQRS